MESEHAVPEECLPSAWAKCNCPGLASMPLKLDYWNLITWLRDKIKEIERLKPMSLEVKQAPGF